MLFHKIKIVLFAISFFAFSLIPLHAYVLADDCAGPAEMCEQMSELKEQVSELRASNEKLSKPEDDISQKMVNSIAMAGAIAVVLRMLMSILRSWKGRVHTDRDKAIIKISTLAIGVLTFVATNVGAGLPWWQSVVIAGGGPGAMAVHEIMKLIPVLQGKKKMPLSNPPSNPPPAGDSV